MFKPVSFLKKNWVVNVCFVTALLVIFPRFFYIELPATESVVDSGWIWALKFFASHREKLVWGKDVIYTYGPLGVFSTRYFPQGYAVYQLLLDLYVVLNLAVVFRLLKKLAGGTALVYLFLVSLLVAVWEVGILIEILNLVFLILLFKNPKLYRLAGFIFFNATLLAYIKLNTLLSTVFIVVTLLVLLCSYKKYLYAAALFIMLVLVNALVIHQLNISPLGYLTTSFDIILGYSYAMYNFSSGYRAPLVAGVVFTAIMVGSLLAVLFYGKKGQFNLAAVLVTGNVALLYFLLFKEGFTRLDEEHFHQYISMLALVLFCALLLFAKPHRLLYACQITAIAAPVLMGALVASKAYPGVGSPLFTGPLPLVNYVGQLLSAFKTDVDIRVVASNQKSADFALNQCLYGRNNPNINWHNRPAFQSIATESATLDAINTRYYEGPDAPDTVFFDNYTVDNRNPLWDDPQCKWAIFKKYKYLYTDSLHQLVLVKREKSLVQTDSLLLDTTVAVGQPVNLPRLAAGMVVLETEVKYTLLGKLRATAFQPPNVNIVLGLDTSGNYTPKRRFISPLHNSQRLIINYYMLQKHNEKFIPLMEDFNRVSPNVKNFTFTTDMKSGVVSRLHITLYRTMFNN
jgi:hypothetical protein